MNEMLRPLLPLAEFRQRFEERTAEYRARHCRVSLRCRRQLFENNLGNRFPAFDEIGHRTHERTHWPKVRFREAAGLFVCLNRQFDRVG